MKPLEQISSGVAVIILALIGWFGITVINLRVDAAANTVNINNLLDRTKDMVPREEHMRQWNAQDEINERTLRRLEAIESYLRQRNKGEDAKFVKPPETGT
jgi:hypothetical protein